MNPSIKAAGSRLKLPTKAAQSGDEPPQSKSRDSASERGDLRLIRDLRQKLDLALVNRHQEADGILVLRVLGGHAPRLRDGAVEQREVALVLHAHGGPQRRVAAQLDRLLK